MKNVRNLFLAVQIEKTEIKYFAKRIGKMAFLLFKLKQKNYF